MFPVGAKLSSWSTRNDMGGVDRIELTNPSKVRWIDGVYRQANPREQYSGMPGNLADAAVVVSNGIAIHYSSLLDTTYTVETLGGVKLLKFAAMPTGFEDRDRFQRMFSERNGGVWFAFKSTVPTIPNWNIRLNGSATTALWSTLDMPSSHRCAIELGRWSSWRRQAWLPRGGLFFAPATLSASGH